MKPDSLGGGAAKTGVTAKENKVFITMIERNINNSP
jgi:hypothetical protein